MNQKLIVVGKIGAFLISYFIILVVLQFLVIILYLIATGNDLLIFFDTERLQPIMDKQPIMLLFQIMSVLSIFICAFLFTRLIDKKSIPSLGFSFNGKAIDFVMGFIVAALIMGIGFIILYLNGSIQLMNVQFHFQYIILSFLIYICVAVAEETLCRGYILGNLMNITNKFVSLILSSLLFALLHIFNPNLALLPMINLFLAGLLLGASYMYTRNLWFPISLHLFWNYIQGPILGYNVSGTNTGSSVFILNYPVKDSLNGGDFGFEGSIICSILSIMGTVAIIAYYEIKNKKNDILKVSLPKHEENSENKIEF